MTRDGIAAGCLYLLVALTLTAYSGWSARGCAERMESSGDR